MSSNFNEDSRVKIPALIHLQRLGYKYLSLKHDIDNFNDKTNILTSVLKKKILELNPSYNENSLEIKHYIDNLEVCLENNDLGREFYLKLTASSGIKMIDFDHPENNDFYCVTEMSCKNGEESFRPDITLYVNGLPLAFIEVKIPNNRDGVIAERERINKRSSNESFRRFLNLFQISMYSNNMEYDNESIVPIQGAFYSTSADGHHVFNCFREPNGNKTNAKAIDYESFPYLRVTEAEENFVLKDTNLTVIKNSPEYQTNKDVNTPTNRTITSLFSKERFLFILRYAIAFVDVTEEQEGISTRTFQKHIMRYQQLFATEAIRNTIDDNIKSGIIWHTQGSGKTALAYYNVRALTDYFANKHVVPQFYFIVDRIDLLEQATKEFQSRGLTVNIVNDKKSLMRQLSERSSVQNVSGSLEITVVNIQKFGDTENVDIPHYNTKLQRVFFLDEAHRGYRPGGCFLANLFESDPNSIKIALTGTPLIGEEKNSCAIFGDYIDTYYYNSSVADGYTLKLIREDIRSDYKIQLEGALEQVKIRERDFKSSDVLSDRSFVEGLHGYITEDLKHTRLVTRDSTIAGMVVCDSSAQARMLYEIFEETEGASGLTAKLILHDEGDKDSRKRCIEEYKRKDTIDFLIVYNMLLTGFDANRLKKLYLGRKLKEHGLLQALTRVNRTYNDFKYGYVVDFADIKENFDKTNAAYLRELTKEVGEENIETFSQILESEESIHRQLDEIKESLFKYDCSNAEIFNQQMNEIADKAELYRIRKSLLDLKNLNNVIRTFGDKQFVEQFNTIPAGKTQDLLREVTRRIGLVNLKDNITRKDEVGGLIVEAMSTIDFNFVKVGEEELRMTVQDYQETLRKLGREFANNIDSGDEAYINLAEALRKFFAKRGIDPSNISDAKEKIEYMEHLMLKMREINRKNRLLQKKYSEDSKYVRVHKRLVERGALSKKEHEICDTLNNLKDTVDANVLQNNGIMDNKPFFKQVIQQQLSLSLNKLKLRATVQDKTYISDLIYNEYVKEFSTSSVSRPKSMYREGSDYAYGIVAEPSNNNIQRKY